MQIMQIANKEKIIHSELSYLINGILFSTHNNLKLGILVNFRDKYLKPHRILNSKV